MADQKVIVEEMPVIQDVMNFKYELTEDKDEQDQVKAYRLKGVFQQADVKNGNGRYYPRAVLEKEVARMRSIIVERRVLGELDHPADAKIHLDKVSHMITMLEMRTNGEMYGEATVLETPSGKVLQELLKSGVMLGISSRGFGSVKKHNGVDEVSDDYKMVTFDIVSDPSTPRAFPQVVFEEKEEKIEEDKVSLSVLIEDIFDMDDLTDRLNIDLEREYIGTANKTRFYLKEGSCGSYGTLRNHVSHYWHLELKNNNGMIKVGLIEAKLNQMKEEFGEDVINKALEKIGYRGFNPKTLLKAKTEFASDKITTEEV